MFYEYYSLACGSHYCDCEYVFVCLLVQSWLHSETRMHCLLVVDVFRLSQISICGILVAFGFLAPASAELRSQHIHVAHATIIMIILRCGVIFLRAFSAICFVCLCSLDLSLC